MIRPAKPSDQDVLGRFGAALMRQHHTADRRRFILTDRPEAGYGRFLVSQLGDEETTVLVAEREGEGVGQGAGRELVRAAIDWIQSRGMSQVVLWSESKNETAQRLFAAMGFRRTMVEMTLDRDDVAPNR